MTKPSPSRVVPCLACWCVLAATPVAAETLDEKALLEKLDRQFDQETAEKGVEAWVSYFAPNGSMVLGTRPPITGPEAIRKAMTPVFTKPGHSLRWKPTEARILIPGKLGYTTGRFESRGKDKQGKTVIGKGTYLSVWQKQPDGSWKILLDTGSPDDKPARKKNAQPK